LIETRIPSFIPNVINEGTSLANTNNPQLIQSVGEDGRVFDQFLRAAMDVVNATNERIIESDTEQVRFATGQSNDMLTVIMAQDRAGSALNFTVQVTNRIVEAYREIMRMQV